MATLAADKLVFIFSQQKTKTKTIQKAKQKQTKTIRNKFDRIYGNDKLEESTCFFFIECWISGSGVGHSFN